MRERPDQGVAKRHRATHVARGEPCLGRASMENENASRLEPVRNGTMRQEQAIRSTAASQLPASACDEGLRRARPRLDVDKLDSPFPDGNRFRMPLKDQGSVGCCSAAESGKLPRTGRALACPPEKPVAGLVCPSCAPWNTTAVGASVARAYTSMYGIHQLPTPRDVYLVSLSRRREHMG